MVSNMKRSFLISAIALSFLGTGVRAQTVATTTASTSPTEVMSAEGCDPAVASEISSAQMAQINGESQLATKILQTSVSGLEYNTASCLGNILGLSPNISLPTVSSLLNQFDNFVCQKTQEFVSPYTNDISSGLSSLTNNVNGYLYKNMSLGTVGGMNFGTIPFGVTLASGSNGSSGQLANVADIYTSGYQEYLGQDPSQPVSDSVYVDGFNNYMEETAGMINEN